MVVFFAANSIFCKQFSLAYPGKKSNASPIFTVPLGILTSLIALVLAGFRFQPSAATVWFGLATALAIVGYNAFLMLCAQTGAYSVMMVFSIAGIIVIPAVFSAIVYGDRLTVPKIVCIVLILAAVYLVSYRKGEKLSRSRAFFPSCFGLACCNGLYGILLNAQQHRMFALHGVEGVERNEMLIVSYAGAAALSFLLILFTERKGTFVAFAQTRRSLLFLAGCVTAASVANNLLIYLVSTVSNVTVLYAVNNAGMMLLGILASAVFLKEKISPPGAVGCAVLAAAIVGITVF